MSTYTDKPISLVERKKLQWAKEKEELAGLNGFWMIHNKHSQNFSRSYDSARNRYGSKLNSMANNEIYPNNKDSVVPNSRRSSLPPLYKTQYNSIDREPEMGGETSGYASDNPNQITDPSNQLIGNWNNQSGYESSSSYRDDRPKWRDKNYGKFWDSKEEFYEKIHEPPNWVKRGLQRDGEIVVSNTSPAESPQQDDNNSSNRNSCRTFIRGQNIPMDSMELAEREKRRQIALAHQEAIRQQLEEREKWRKLEQERKIREEREEELRIEREQEIERQRKENELKMMKEKQEREMKRKEAIREAIELAEKEAKLERMKLKQNNNNNNMTDDDERDVQKEKCSTIKNCNNLNNRNNHQDIQNQDENNDNNNNNNKLMISPKPRNLDHEINNLRPPTTTKTMNISKISENLDSNNSKDTNNQNYVSSATIPNLSSLGMNENLALILQTPVESLQNVQYAVLMPAATTPTSIPIAVPVNLASSRSFDGSSPRTENRILTPTQYRNRNRRLCDSSTQTDYSDFSRTDTAETMNSRKGEKLTNQLEMVYDNNRNRMIKESRQNSRCDNGRTERPKWGVNRPPTRYMKQSEKDPLYQRRKLRQKMRDTKMYEYKNSSDESQTGSPTNYRKNYIEKRQTRALWRKNSHVFSRNVRMYQTEIVPIESDKDHIYYNKRNLCQHCCCRCRCNSQTQNILKIDNNSPREEVQQAYKCEIIEQAECLQDGKNDDEIIEKLVTKFNEGLIATDKNEHWDQSPRTASFSSSAKNT